VTPALVRALYFTLVPPGVTSRMPQVIDILGAELPTYLFFSVTSLIVFWWIELYHNAANLQASFLGESSFSFP
jgi:hypothetical protein